MIHESKCSKRRLCMNLNVIEEDNIWIKMVKNKIMWEIKSLRRR